MRDRKAAARKTLATAALKLGVGEDELLLTFRQVTEDPYNRIPSLHLVVMTSSQFKA